MLRLISILILFCITLCSKGQGDDNIELLIDYTSRFGQADIQFDNPGRTELNNISRNISVYEANSTSVWATLSSHDIPYMKDFPYPYKVIGSSDSKAVISALSVAEAMNWDRYPTYQQYDTIMRSFASDYPGICRLDTIGTSIEGRLVMALKISDNVNSSEDEPAVFYSSTMHGDELAGYVLMLRLAEHLLSNSSNGGLEQQLIDSLEIWINPLANPDGTYRFGDTISSPTRFNANGKDLNRNFPDPSEIPGTIQKENLDMIAFMKKNGFVLSANFHSGAEVLNYPWDRNTDDWTGKIHADSTWFFSICKSYVDTVHLYSAPGYLDDVKSTGAYPGVTRGDAWYIAPGTRQDYITYERQGREITIEIDYTKETPASELPTMWNDNYRSLLAYLSNAFYGIHGKVIDDVTEDPIKASIFILDHDKDSSHVYSDTLSGEFVRLIDEGSWNLAFSAPGYETKFINNVSIEEFKQKHLLVRLIKDTSEIPNYTEDKLLIWPVPASDLLNIELPPTYGGVVSIEIVNSVGSLVYKDSEAVPGNNLLRVPIDNLSSGFHIIKISYLTGTNVITGRFIVR